MKYVIKNLMLVLFFVLQLSAKANIRLPSVISSNMVLQQKSDVSLWGWGSPGENVFVTNTWNGAVDSIQVDGNAKWKVQVKTPAAGGPFTITVRGYNTLVLENVMIGEVWVCSGQSNMEFNFNWGLPDMRNDFPSAANPSIRFFNIPRTTADNPQEDVRATWTTCDSNTLKSFSAVAYYFARKLNSDLHIPIGLINASWGGTPAETWTPALVVKGNGILQDAAIRLTPSNGWPVTPGAAFNGMIAPILNYAIAGAIWYQGESNTGTAETYQQLFSAMVSSWRDLWKKQFPFYFVQLAPYHYENKNVAALLREQQVKSLSIPATGMAVTTDLADDTLDIHPKNKRDVGIRLAKMALADMYGGDTIGSRSPVFKSMESDKDKIILSFDNTDGAILSKGKPSGVLIAGADQKFYPAAVRFSGDKIIVSAKQVKQPVAVRYAFSNTAAGNLFSKTGLPVSPFRTDNWVVDTSNEKQNP